MADAYVVSPDFQVNSTDAPNVRSWKVHAERINRAWGQGAANVIAVGKLLNEANDELPRDAFNAMVKSKLDFVSSVARKLIRIAANQTLCSPGSVSVGYIDRARQLSAAKRAAIISGEDMTSFAALSPPKAPLALPAPKIVSDATLEEIIRAAGVARTLDAAIAVETHA